MLAERDVLPKASELPPTQLSTDIPTTENVPLGEVEPIDSVITPISPSNEPKSLLASKLEQVRQEISLILDPIETRKSFAEQSVEATEELVTEDGSTLQAREIPSKVLTTLFKRGANQLSQQMGREGAGPAVTIEEDRVSMLLAALEQYHEAKDDPEKRASFVRDYGDQSEQIKQKYEFVTGMHKVLVETTAGLEHQQYLYKTFRDVVRNGMDQEASTTRRNVDSNIEAEFVVAMLDAYSAIGQGEEAVVQYRHDWGEVADFALEEIESLRGTLADKEEQLLNRAYTRDEKQTARALYKAKEFILGLPDEYKAVMLERMQLSEESPIDVALRRGERWGPEMAKAAAMTFVTFAAPGAYDAVAFGIANGVAAMNPLSHLPDTTFNQLPENIKYAYDVISSQHAAVRQITSHLPINGDTPVREGILGPLAAGAEAWWVKSLIENGAAQGKLAEKKGFSMSIFTNTLVNGLNTYFEEHPDQLKDHQAAIKKHAAIISWVGKEVGPVAPFYLEYLSLIFANHVQAEGGPMDGLQLIQVVLVANALTIAYEKAMKRSAEKMASSESSTESLKTKISKKVETARKTLEKPFTKLPGNKLGSQVVFETPITSAQEN